MNKYPSDWDSRRERVYRRDNYKCQNCGKSGGPNGTAELHAHHIVPKSKGGSNKIDNLTTLCKECHDAIHHNNKTAPTARSDESRSVEKKKISKFLRIRKELSSEKFYALKEFHSDKIGDASDVKSARRNGYFWILFKSCVISVPVMFFIIIITSPLESMLGEELYGTLILIALLIVVVIFMIPYKKIRDDYISIFNNIYIKYNDLNEMEDDFENGSGVYLEKSEYDSKKDQQLK